MRWFAAMVVGLVAGCEGEAVEGLSPAVDVSAAKPNVPPEEASSTELDALGDLAASSPPTSGTVPRRRTPIGGLELAVTLDEAHRLTFAEPPSVPRLSVAWAHLALEHKRGNEVDNFNLGNLSRRDEPGTGATFVRLLRERKRSGYGQPFGPWRWVEVRFAAFPTALAGARAYWEHLHAHYGKALTLFDTGDGYRVGLKLAHDGYATAEAEPYASALKTLTKEFHLKVVPSLQTR